jgi:Tfp pilus assembly protein PilX
MHQRRDAMIARLARRAHHADEGVAMLLALMVILMLLTISITVAGVTMSQVKPSQLERKTTVTESAAEAGFDIALNRIRAANTGVLATDPYTGQPYLPGSRAALPCPTITGAVDDGSATDSSYTVKLVYYSSDPSLGGATAITCTAGAPASVPSFVQITSTGSAKDVNGTRVGSGNRVLQTVYALKTNNANVAGGTIPFYSDLTLCFAVSDVANTVKVGDKLTVAACSTSTPIDPRQLFSYTPNLELAISATNGTGPLCLQGAATVHTVPTLQLCSQNGLPPASPYTLSTQVWSYNDSGQFQASNTTDTGLASNICLNLYTGATPTAIAPLAAGDFIDIDTCGAQTVPTAKVGAGAAGSALRPFQLVNYLYFGRCIDTTNQDVQATWLIGYPCKQDPLATNLTWNQKWYTGVSDGDGGTGANAAYGGTPGTGGNTTIATTAPATGCQITQTQACQFIEYPNGANGASSGSAYYCLEAGNSASPSAPINGTIVTSQPCSSTDNYQKWTYTSNLYSSYAQQYLIQPYGAATSHLCLTMTIGSTPPGLTYDTVNAGGAPIPAYGYISLQTCNTVASPDLSQKWNAPPNVAVNQLKNTLELPNP